MICGEPLIGESTPSRCPFCGAYEKYMVEAQNTALNWNLELTPKEIENVKSALKLEISNSNFYFCAAEKTTDLEGKQLFRALGKVEAEHANIWRRVLKNNSSENSTGDSCSMNYTDNLNESHTREDNAINQYSKFESESLNPRLKILFKAVIEIEIDHLNLSEMRLKKDKAKAL